MKTTTGLLIILYFGIFTLGGYFFYTKYYQKIISPEVATPKENKTENIYYSAVNSLYQLNPGILKQSPQEIPTIRLQSTGQVAQMEIVKADNIFFYDTLTPQNNWEIWKVSLNDNSSEKLFSNQTPGLENFKNFRDPQVSKDNLELAFIATHDEIDNLFLYNLKNKNLTNLSHQLFQGKIDSYSWSPDSQKLFFSSSSSDQGTIYQIDVGKKLDKLWEGPGQINKITGLKDKVIFSLTESGENPNINLNLLTLSDKQKKAITNLTLPKQVKNFQLSLNGDYLVAEVAEKDQQKSDLYLLKSDGTNLLQLTDDGRSSKAVFSPEGSKIAFWVKGDGIYIMNINKNQRQKILNYEENIDQILRWS